MPSRPSESPTEDMADRRPALYFNKQRNSVLHGATGFDGEPWGISGDAPINVKPP
jgi:hypothetical protein